jgi:hypothetical protein
VFDPPAELPSVPAAALGLVILVVFVGLATAYLVAGRAMRGIDVLAALRER